MKKIQGYAKLGGMSLGKGITDDEFEREMNRKIEDCIDRLCEELKKHQNASKQEPIQPK